MLVVIALGGNALLRRGDPTDQVVQQRNVEVAARAIAAIARTSRVVVTHGNGPQVGLLALAQGEHATLDVLGSETQGMIGYLVEDAVRDELPGVEVATLLTQVVVDPVDPAFARPTKPIGPQYSEQEARALEGERGWTFARDGEHLRRVVPSPEPRRILELGAIRLLSEHGVLVVCAGGGGIPVVPAGGGYAGVEAVIDKDLTSALLATALGADVLLLLTDVEGVELGWRTAEPRRIVRASPASLRAIEFAEGSMAPKVEAACRFVEATGHRAAIGRLEDGLALLEGHAGTSVERDVTGIELA